MVADHGVASVLAWLGTYVVHSTVLLLAAWTACTLLTRRGTRRDALPALREGLWRVALLGSLATTTAQLALDVAPASALWTIEAPTGVASAPHAASAVPRAAEPVELALAAAPATDGDTAVPVLRVPLFVPFQREFVPSTLPLDTRAPLASLPPEALVRAADAPETPALPWTRALLALWLAGVAAGAAWWAREWIALGRSLRRRIPLQRGPAYDVFAQLCARTGTRGVRLSCAPGLAAPIALGFWRPEIVIPPRATVQLAPDELEALFAHELAHVRRDDALWLVVYRALEVVFFFQPLNRAACARLQDDAELLADDWAVTQLPSRVSLASCLTEIAGWIVDGRRLLPAPGMAARGTRLTLRVRRLLDDEHHPERARRPNAFVILAGSLACGAALFVPGVAARAHDFAASASDALAARGEQEPGNGARAGAFGDLGDLGDDDAADSTATEDLGDDSYGTDTDENDTDEADTDETDTDETDDTSDTLDAQADDLPPDPVGSALFPSRSFRVVAPPGWDVAVWSGSAALAQAQHAEDAQRSITATLDEASELARDLASLRAELARRRATPQVARRLDALERELAGVRDQGRALARLVAELEAQRAANWP